MDENGLGNARDGEKKSVKEEVLEEGWRLSVACMGVIVTPPCEYQSETRCIACHMNEITFFNECHPHIGNRAHL